MDGVRVSADPEHVGGGKVWDMREFAQGPAEEERDFPPVLEEKIEEQVLLTSRSLLDLRYWLCARSPESSEP